MAGIDERQGKGPARRRARDEPSPTNRALGLLTRREHSRKELLRKLAARGVEQGEAEAAVSRLADAGWQDDARFAETLVRTRAAGGHGPVRIRAELRTHGLPDETIDRALAAHDADWSRNARDIARRRFGPDLDGDPARCRKAAQFLYRRGFDGDQVRAATGADPDG